jgi:hypothetical protein
LLRITFAVYSEFWRVVFFMSDHQDRGWLIEHYVDRNLSCNACAKLAGVSTMTIHKWLKRHGIARRGIGDHMKGESNPRRGQPLSDATRRKIGQAMTGHIRSPESIQKQREKISGANSTLFGKPRTHGKTLWIERPDGRLVAMRSRWEVLFADMLAAQSEDWDYEPRTFTFADGSTYTPDFLARGVWYEVKGYMTDSDQAKIDRFRVGFPDLDFRVIRKTDMDALGLDPKKSMILRSIKLIVGRIRTCPTCHLDFVAKLKQSRFCCRKCAARSKPTNKARFECVICGATGWAFPSKAASQKTCSKECRYKAMVISRKESGAWFR